MRYRIRHRTSYRYASEVFESFNEVRLQPLAGATQTLLDFDLLIEPPATVISFRDYYVPPYGWLGVDATLGTLCTGQHVSLGVGRDYADVAVLRGTYQGGGQAELEVEVTTEELGGVGQLAQLRGSDHDPVARLVAIQNLGAMRQYQRGAVMTQAMGGMTQTLSLEELPPLRAQLRPEDGPPSQQPQQQQQQPKRAG